LAYEWPPGEAWEEDEQAQARHCEVKELGGGVNKAKVD